MKKHTAFIEFFDSGIPPTEQEVAKLFPGFKVKSPIANEREIAVVRRDIQYCLSFNFYKKGKIFLAFFNCRDDIPVQYKVLESYNDFSEIADKLLLTLKTGELQVPGWTNNAPKGYNHDPRTAKFFPR